MFSKIASALALLALCGCTTYVAYSPAPKTGTETAGALLFQLQDSKITLGKLYGSAATGAPQSNCPDGTVLDKNWDQCLQKTAAAAVMAPSASADDLYLAKPDDGFFAATTTTLSGSLVTGQDHLYNVVTVKYTNNVGTIVAGAGTGAVAGFGIGGPIGAGIGFVAGALTSDTNLGAEHRLVAVPHDLLTPYICPADQKKLSFVESAKAPSPSFKAPALSLPVTISAADARPYAKSPMVSPIPATGIADECWHFLPNASQLGTKLKLPAGAAPQNDTPRAPVSGDGWLYRLVATTQDPAPDKLAATYFSTSGARQDFPYSFCRNVTLQITWWKELDQAIQSTNKDGSFTVQPEVITFTNLMVADPKWVDTADVRKGAAVNFKQDCGVAVSRDVDTSNIAVINTAVTQMENLYKAEQTWQSSAH